MRVVPVDSPRRKDAFGETIFTGTPDVIHDLLATIFDNRFPDLSGEFIEHFVPTSLHPFPFAAFSGAFERVQNAIRIVDLVESGGTFRAVAATRTWMFRIAFKLLNFACDLIDIGEQTARRLAIETGRGNQGVVALFALRPCLRIELSPIVPTLLW